MTKSPAIIGLRPKSKGDVVTHSFYSMGVDIDALLTKVVENDLDSTECVEIERTLDDQLEWAPNCVEFMIDPRFLNIRPYAKQLEAMLNTVEDFCWACSDIEYVRNIPVLDTIETITSKIALLEFGVCPHCNQTKAEGRKRKIYKDPIEMLSIWGQRTGKSAGTSAQLCYQLHRFLHLSSPWKTFKLTPNQPLEASVIATTLTQASNSIWAAFTQTLLSSPWFQKYQTVANAEGQEKFGKNLVRATETFFWFEHKSILLNLLSPSPSGLRGSTRFAVVLDEFGYFAEEAGKTRASGPEVYASTKNSLATLRGSADTIIAADPSSNVPTGVMYAISSPRHQMDPIVSLARTQATNPRTFYRKYATWEANPTLSLAKLEALQETGAATFERDFGAKVPLTDNPLFPSQLKVEDAFATPLALPGLTQILLPTMQAKAVEINVEEIRSTKRYLSGEIDRSYKLPDYEIMKRVSETDKEALGRYKGLFEELMATPPTRRPHIMSVDLGTTRNACGVAAGYLGLKGTVFVTDFLFNLKPSNNRTINIEMLFDSLIDPLCQELNCVTVAYDRWSSASHLARLAMRYGAQTQLKNKTEHNRTKKALQDNKRGSIPFLTEQISLNMTMAQDLVSQMHQGNCLFPAQEIPFMDLMLDKTKDPTNYPVATLALQTCTVRSSGRALLKPAGNADTSDDDLWRSWANCATLALNDSIIRQLLMSTNIDRKPLGKKPGSGSFMPVTGNARSGRASGAPGSSSLTSPGNYVIGGSATRPRK